MPHTWTIKEIRDLVEKWFNKRLCWYQIKVALALHTGKDVITCAAMGAGKMLSFWIALLMAMEEGKDKMMNMFNMFLVCDEVTEDVDKGHNRSTWVTWVRRWFDDFISNVTDYCFTNTIKNCHYHM